MRHLTVDQIIEFVSISKLDEQAVELSATVTGHIRKCSQCFERVKAFQLINDALSEPQTYEETEQYVDRPMLVAYEAENTVDADR